MALLTNDECIELLRSIMRDKYDLGTLDEACRIIELAVYLHNKTPLNLQDFIDELKEDIVCDHPYLRKYLNKLTN